MAQSHYPSSAELAAFRQHVSLITFRVVGIGTFHPPSGAWPHERQHGIGHTIMDGPLAWTEPFWTGIARR